MRFQQLKEDLVIKISRLAFFASQSKELLPNGWAKTPLEVVRAGLQLQIFGVVPVELAMALDGVAAQMRNQ